MNARDLNQIRQALLALVQQTGRDDIGLGEIVQEGDVVRFTLTRGHFSHTDEMALELLQDPQQARVRMNSIVFKLSKQVEREHLRHAG